MKRALYAIRIVALALSAGTALAACSSGGSSTATSSANPVSTGPTFNGAPLGTAQRTPQANRPTSPSALAGWHSASQDSGSFSPLSAGKRGVPEFTLTGNGAAVAKEIYGPVLRVQPGKTYMFSAWIDASKVAKGNTILWVSNDGLTRIYAAAAVPPKQSGRFSFSFTIPSDVSRIHFGYYTAGIVLPAGQKITFSAPRVDEQRG
jgi:hypothetical protein